MDNRQPRLLDLPFVGNLFKVSMER